MIDHAKNLVHCIYTSATVNEFSMNDIESLLSVARKKNYELGVTGILLYEDGSFFQVLEGAQVVVQSLYKSISKDPRHQRVTKVIYEPIEDRQFGDWTMGYAGVTTKQLGQIEGLNDFFRSGKCYADLDESRAKKLLRAFKGGRWRATIA